MLLLSREPLQFFALIHAHPNLVNPSMNLTHVQSCDNSCTDWSDLQLTDLQRIVVSGPRFPCYSVGVGMVWASQIATIDVGRVTLCVPRCAFVLAGARPCRQAVVVLVPSAKRMSSVSSQRVTFVHHTHEHTSHAPQLV